MKLFSVTSALVSLFLLLISSAFAKSPETSAAENANSIQLTVEKTLDPAQNCNSTDSPKEVVSTSEQFMAVLHQPQKAGHVSVQGLVGRVLKGKTDADFETLSEVQTRKLIFMMGSDGLEGLIGLSTDQILIKIGYTPEYIQRLKDEGYHLKLVVFSSKNEAAVPATWDNVAHLVEKLYPSVASKIDKQLPALKSTPFSLIESQAPERFYEVDKLWTAHPDYINEEKLEKSEGKLWQVRGFLYYQARLSDLYSGDGYTHTDDGGRGLKEYVAPNVPIKSLNDASVADLNGGGK
jgi:hypothetical protein